MKPKRSNTIARILALSELVHAAGLDSKIRKEINRQKLVIGGEACAGRRSEAGSALYELTGIARREAALDEEMLASMKQSSCC